MDRKNRLYEIVNGIVDGARNTWSSHDEEREAINDAIFQLEHLMDETINPDNISPSPIPLPKWDEGFLNQVREVEKRNKNK